MKCSECGGVNGHADPFCSKLDLKAALAVDNSAGALNVHQFAAISTAIRETIEAGCKRHWNQSWLFSSEDSTLDNQEKEDFIAEVTRRLAEKAK